MVWFDDVSVAAALGEEEAPPESEAAAIRHGGRGQRAESSNSKAYGRGFEGEKFCLTYSYMGMYCAGMARAATTSDAFNAVAEPRRREILNYLALQERPVGDIVATLRLEQPSVSKHLRVLKDVGLVRVRRDGRRMLYRTNADAIRPLHEWAGTFEQLWRHQLNRVKERAEAKAKETKFDPNARRDDGGNGDKN